ncbi:MAG: hypothetical protein AAGM22_18685 [Acidobacteriota bacterium]
MPASLDALLQRLTEHIEGGQKLKIIVPQDTGFFTLDPELVEGILVLLNATVATMRQVTETFEEAAPERGASTLAPQEVADLAFVCRTELVELEKSLRQASEAKNLWKTAAEADRAVARAIRAMIPIESSLREYAGLDPIERTWFDLDDALAIRRRFVDFWLECKRRGNPEGPDLKTAFQVFSQGIADLRQDALYPYLRIDDRLQIRSLQKRILAHMEKDPESRGLEGRRLWQDLVGFFDLLMHIQRREELREHDRLLVGRVCRLLFDLKHLPEHLPQETHEQLRSLASLEPTLDVLLLPDQPARSADYRQPLETLRAKLV